MLLSGLLGNETAEKVLLFMKSYGAGYPSAVSKTFDIPVSQAQRQMERLEREGILVSSLIGKTRQYQWNPRYLFQKELDTLLAKALANLPEDYINKYFRKRTRPRRMGKPLP